MTGARRVYFYVNGMPRLLMAAVIASEVYPGAEKELILLDQFGYRYEPLLSHVSGEFSRVHRFAVRTRRYSHWDQFVNCYVNRFADLRAIIRPDSTVVLFGIRSPAQKFIVRLNGELGNDTQVYAESLAADRCFATQPDRNPAKRCLRALFARAFAFQHDYDAFHVLCRELYRDSPHADRIRQMFNLYDSDAFRRYAALLTPESDLEAAREFDTVFFGQPMSNFDGRLSRGAEESLLRRIVGDRRVLVLPHPNEVLGPENKYSVLPNARVLRTSATSDLLVALVRPRATLTFASTIGVTYAIANPQTVNGFHPLYRSQVERLRRYAEFVRNVQVDDSHVIDESPYAG